MMGGGRVGTDAKKRIFRFGCCLCLFRPIAVQGNKLQRFPGHAETEGEQREESQGAVDCPWRRAPERKGEGISSVVDP